jgi:DNA-binding transcriptional LysR family regulator
MELTQVRYFLALARVLNFSRAAEACHVTQPAFSRAIARLEEEFGGALILREGTQTRLTQLGEDMRAPLQAMMEAADTARALAAAHIAGPGGLRIGFGPGIAAGVVGAEVAEVLRAMPEAEVQFTEASSAGLSEALLADALDCALVPEGDLPERLHRWPLYLDRAALVCPVGHRLAARNQCMLADLAGETLLVGDACGGFGARAGQGVALRPCRGTHGQVLDLVAAGLGVALLSERLSLPPSLTARRFVEPELTRRIYLTAVAGRVMRPAAGAFVKLCRARGWA